MYISYCNDEIYSLLKNSTSPAEYPFTMLLSDNSYITRGFIDNPVNVITSNYIDHPNSFILLEVVDKDDMYVEITNQISKCIDKPSFFTVGEIDPIFEFSLYNVHIANYINGSYLRDYIGGQSSVRIGMYSNEYKILNDTYTIRGLKIKKVENNPSAYNNTVIFDSNRNYSYLYDRKFVKMLKKDIRDGQVVIDTIYTQSSNSASKIRISKFYTHTLHFKSQNVLSRYYKYTSKHFSKDYPVVYSSYVDDPVNVRIKKINSLREHFMVNVGQLHNKSKLYEVIFDWDEVESYDIMDDIMKEIENGTFYTDTPISKKDNSKLSDYYIYINEDKFLNKIKMMSKWKTCIEEIIVNEDVTK